MVKGLEKERPRGDLAEKPIPKGPTPTHEANPVAVLSRITPSPNPM